MKVSAAWKANIYPSNFGDISRAACLFCTQSSEADASEMNYEEIDFHFV